MQSEIRNEIHNNAPEVQGVVSEKPSKRNIAAVGLIIFSIVMLLAAFALAYLTLSKDTIYKGVTVNGVPVSGLTESSASEFLGKQFGEAFSSLNITIIAGGETKTISYKDLDVVPDIALSAAEAYSVGHKGNIIDRLNDIIMASIKGIDISLSVSYDTGKLSDFIDTFYNQVCREVKEPDVFILAEKVFIRSGQSGISFDKNAVRSEIERIISGLRNGEVTIETTVTKPSGLDVDEIYALLNREPSNAGFKLENGEVTVTPHVVGMSIEKNVLSDIIAELENEENVTKELPVVVTMPQITMETAKERLLADTLATYQTSFSTSDVNNRNRAENMKLAASKIDGTLLMPGEEFSFNGIVGPRTEAMGYKAAHSYVAGKVVDEIGGGICQVSTTLYGAVLKSDLEVVERRNHTFTVGYVPYGQDATVSYGTTDFRFRNSTSWPIKIHTGFKGNSIYFTLIGTNETPNKQVILSHKQIKQIPFETKYIDDPTLKEGETKVLQSGKDGFVVDSYKIIKIDGQVVSQTKLHNSRYIPLTQEILRGTKPVPGSSGSGSPAPGTPAPSSPAPESSGSGSQAPGTSDPGTAEPGSAAPGPGESVPVPSTGVDDAGNPPAPDMNESIQEGL